MLTGSETHTQTGSGTPMLAGSGMPILAGPWLPMLASPGLPTLADSRMSALTLSGQGMHTLLASNTAYINYLFNFLVMVLLISADLLGLIVFLICSYNEIDYLTWSHPLAQGSDHP